MLVKITVQGGVVTKVETSEAATIQICDLDARAQYDFSTATFETGASEVVFDLDDDEAA